MFEQINRAERKAQVRDILQDAQVSPRSMTALLLLLVLATDLVSLVGGEGLFGIFVSVLCSLLTTVLNTGFVLYCMTILRRQRAEYLTLFDAFSFAGKLIALQLIMYAFVTLWSMLFLIPGLVAAYRYRFAIFNLCENPEMNPIEALEMSKRQTQGYKLQLVMLDLSYVGWMILAALPAYAYSGYVSYMTLGGGNPVLSSATTFLLSLGFGLWSLLVSLFYFPEYQCVELTYFDTAKRTSGIGFREPPQDPFLPDDMGNY